MMTPTTARSAAFYTRQDFVAGLLVAAVGAFAYWQAINLPVGTFGAIGPGMLPRGLAMLLALLGLALAGSAAFSDGAALGRWSLRGPILIFGALVAFGLSIRPLGLLVAGPLAVLISAGASNETRLFETILFGALITAFCIGLFKFALGLPIPLAPWLIGY